MLWEKYLSGYTWLSFRERSHTKEVLVESLNAFLEVAEIQLGKRLFKSLPSVKQFSLLLEKISYICVLFSCTDGKDWMNPQLIWILLFLLVLITFSLSSTISVWSLSSLSGQESFCQHQESRHTHKKTNSLDFPIKTEN